MGCKTPCQKISNLLEKYPECVPIDTTKQKVELTTPGYVTETERVLIIDSAQTDSLKALLFACGAEAESILTQLQNYIPRAISINPVDTLTHKYHLKIWIKNGKLFHVNEVFPDTVYKEVPLFVQNLLPQGLKSDKTRIAALEKDLTTYYRLLWLLAATCGTLLFAFIKKTFL